MEFLYFFLKNWSEGHVFGYVANGRETPASRISINFGYRCSDLCITLIWMEAMIFFFFCIICECTKSFVCKTESEL